MFENDDDDNNINEFLNDESSSNTEKIINAISKIEVGIISAIAGFFENISLIEETQAIEDTITLNTLNIVGEIQSLREILTNLPSLKDNDSNIQNNNQSEIIEKLDSIIENFKDASNKPIPPIEPKINININEALKPLNQKLEAINSFINEINVQIKTLKPQNVENYSNEQNANEIFNDNEVNNNDNIIESLNCLNENLQNVKEVIENDKNNQEIFDSLNNLNENLQNVKEVIESDKNNQEIFDSLNNLNENLQDLKDIFDSNEYEICNKLSSDIQNLIKAIEINEDIYNHQTQNDIFEAINNLNSKISIITHTYEDTNETDVKNLFVCIDDIIKLLNGIDVNLKTYEEKQNSIDVKYEFDSLKAELSQLIDDKTSDIAGNQSYNVNEIINAIKSIQDHISNLNQVKIESDDEKTNAFREEINSNLTKLSQLIEYSSSLYSSEIQNEIKETKDTIIQSVAVFFENFNFVQEQEAIQNCIEQSKNDINDKINQTYIKIDDKLTPIASTIQNIDVLKDNIGKINNVFFKSSDELDNDNETYIYTFIDLENDIIKLNMMLNDLQASVSQNLDESKNTIKDELSNVSNIVESFKNENTSLIKNEISNVTEIVESYKNENTLLIKDEISNLSSVVESTNEDISSISKRTNKLIILADEAQNTYNSNVEKFKKLTSEIIAQINNLTKLGIDFSKVIKTQNLIASNINNLNEAFVYLGTWIDGVDLIFKSIQENVNSTVKNEDLNLVRISFEDRLNSIENTISNIDNSLNDVTLKLNSYEEINVNIEDKIGSFDETFENIENNINDNNFKINNLSEQIADVENSFNNNLVSKLDRVNEVIEELQNSYEETNSNINEKIENIENKLSNKADYSDKLNEILQKLKENEEKNNEISKQLEQKELLFEQMTHEMDNVRKLNAKINGIEDIITRLDKKITRIVNYIDED